MYQILERYLFLNAGVYGVEEPLNPFYANYREENNRVVWERSANKVLSEDYEKIYRQRLELVKKYHGQLFFKVFPSAFRPEAYSWLMQEHSFITHERKNLFEQVLSNLLSHSTSHWYSDGGIRPDKNSLIASKSAFVTFEKSYFHFLQLKRLVKPEASFFYEDFLEKSPVELLNSAGFSGHFEESNLYLTKKQSPEEKLEVFQNQTEILDWYRGSVLQTFWKV